MQQMNAGGNRNALNQPTDAKGEREWSYGFCDCFGDCGTCDQYLVLLFCPVFDPECISRHHCHHVSLRDICAEQVSTGIPREARFPSSGWGEHVQLRLL